ncbi:cadherin domain protein, partial [Teladorsagia circumcincta]
HTADTVVVVTLRDVNDNAPVFESTAEFLVEENSQRMKVIDVNDHEPLLRSSRTSVEINEVAARGTSILRFEVDDADCIENAASIFGIEEGYGVFGITPTSGELYVSSPLDFESQSHYNITVFAKNIAGGEKSFKSVIVQVKDSNDERPRFVGGTPVQFSVFENLPGPYPAVIGSTISE